MPMETYDPFPWPGHPDFAGFPKQSSNDTISYSIYLPNVQNSKPTERRSRLNEILIASQRLAQKLLKGYIWQRESFSLKFDVSGLSFLHGSTEYGDSLTDEWIIVYILREISNAYEDAWIRMADTDGEFLLIEAAHALPEWLDPDIADHRLWLNKGGLYLIDPPTANEADSNALHPISLEAALAEIATISPNLKRAPEIQVEAFQRLNTFPSAIAKSMHRKRLLIPRKLAHILHRIPYTSSAAVEAIFLHDSEAGKVFQGSSSGRLLFPPQDAVSVSVAFNKVSYAQLVNGEFRAPAMWASHTAENQDEITQQAAENGMKLSCGFELMMAESRNKDRKVIREVGILLADLDAGDEDLPTDEQIRSWPNDDDDESWLDVNFEDFQQELSGQRKPEAESNRTPALKDEATQQNFKRIVENFEKFLADDEAGIDGAEVAKDATENADEENDGDNGDDGSGGDATEDDESSSDEDTDRRNIGEFPKGLEGFDKKRDGKAFAEAMKVLMELDEQGYVERRTSSQVARAATSEYSGNLPDSELSSDDDDGEDIDFEDLQKLTDQMEAELRRSGGLFNTPSDPNVGGHNAPHNDDPRFALAQNLLESMRHGGGQGGPTASMLASMGLNMPLDEDEKR